MEKWHLAGIISNSYKPALILPPNKLTKIPIPKNHAPETKKIISLVQSFIRKFTEVIALF